MILSALANLYAAFPRKIQIGMGSVLGDILYLFKFRPEIAKQNIEYAFPEDKKRQAALLKASYRHLGNLIFEVLMVLGPLKRFVMRNVEVVGLENWEKANSKGRGVIFLSSHLGNWEVMAATGGVLARIDLMLVTKKIKPAWLHRAIENGRLKCGVRATYEPRTAKDVLGHLKKKGTVGFVLDQYAGAPVGVRVPLFGIPVGTSLVVAAFAKRTGAPVVPVINYRKPDGRWVVHVRPEMTWQEFPQFDDPHYELAANTAAYVARLEQDIREHPEQWLWIHRRFKGDLGPIRNEEWHTPRART